MRSNLCLLEREDALKALLELVEFSATAHGRVAVIAGEAGVGKSSLVEALVAGLPDAATVAWGHCDDLFTPRQFGPFLDLAPTLGPEVQNALTTGSTPAGLFPAVLAAIDALPAGSVLVFEDVHWADHASLDLLKFVARRLVPLRVLVLLTYRPDEIGAGHPLTLLLGDLPAKVTTRIDLEPLSPAAVALLAAEHGRDGRELHRTTGGNPFFLSEILAQPDAEGGLPASVRDAVLARAARANADERELLDILSLAPDPVPPTVVERLGGTAGLAARKGLEAQGLLLRDEHGAARFRHELARLSILDALSGAERRAHQRRLLDAYLSLGDAVPPDLIVHHAAAIDEAGLLLEYAPRAAAHAASLGACKAAAAHLAVALRHVDEADPPVAAQLYEDWAYQASLFEVNEQVIAARHQAVDRWRALGRPDRVGENLRWLWRLHWYRGEIDQADAAATESLAILEAIPPSKELARAYALRALINLLRGQRTESINWGRQAIDMAARFDDVETRVPALVTVATAMLFDGDDAGRALMDEALDLGRAHGLHEEVARIHTNYSEYAIVVGDWPLAERLVLEGLAFDIKHGLDSWTTYLKGRHAQLRLNQGRFAEAETLARGALAGEGYTVLMKLPALTTLAIVRSRLGCDDADVRLEEVLQTALGMREQQRITPVRLGLIQHHYLRGQDDAARSHLEAMLDFGTRVLRPWDAGALRVWAARLDMALPPGVGTRPTEAQSLELAGDHGAAATLMDARQQPFDAALCRLAGARAGTPELARQAADGFEALGCRPGVDAARRLAGEASPQTGARSRRRGPYRAARLHPLGLTRREVEVLALMAEGASNADIASSLSRSPRTVEHHVSSILGKLNAANRLEATLRVIAEPWITQR
jgi:DNA-binding NarL/FixJ family response regulator